ncbi:MAG: PaaI family thioesterase [Haloarculaceae archaeon]
MDADPDPTELFDGIPFVEDLGIELTRAADGRAEGRLELAERHTSNERTGVVHGGVTYSLADTVGGAAVYSVVGTSTPTVDMRIDYLAPATGERLRAEAEALRVGNALATVDVTVTDGSGTRVAECRGVYKTGGGDGESAWGERPGA